MTTLSGCTNFREFLVRKKKKLTETTTNANLKKNLDFHLEICHEDIL